MDAQVTAWRPCHQSESQRGRAGRLTVAHLWLAAVIGVAGCGKSESPEGAEAKAPGGANSAAEQASTEPRVTRPIPEADASDEVTPKRRKIIPIELGTDAPLGDAPDKPAPAANGEAQVSSVIERLQPFQVLLGKWNWTTMKKFGNFAKHGEDLAWVWDFRSDKTRPALVFATSEHPYFKTGNLTWLAEGDQFRLTTTSPEGDKRVFEGTWTDGGEPKEEHDGKKVQRSFRMELVQTTPADGDRWKVAIQLLDNDQYQMQLTKKPEAGETFGPLDVVRQQREGTSFAAVDSDNPGPKCIVSGGLGNATVSYMGKSYPVCCSGCAAAFNDDPERWLAKLTKTP